MSSPAKATPVTVEKEGKSMRTPNRLLRATLVSAATALAGLALLAACSGAKKAPCRRVPVAAAAAVKKDVPIVLTAIGTVQAYKHGFHQSAVAVRSCACMQSERQDVRKGDPLFTIDPRPSKRPDVAKALLARDKAQLRQRDAQARRYLDSSEEGPCHTAAGG